MRSETAMIVFVTVVVLALMSLFGATIWAAAKEEPSHLKFNGKELLAVPNDQEISSFDYGISPTNAWINIRFEKKEKDNG